MTARDVAALDPKKAATKSASTKTTLSDLSLVWKVATPEQRRTFFDLIGRDGICLHLSPALMAELRARIRAAAPTAAFPDAPEFDRSATDMLHTAMRCAEQKDPNDEDYRKMAAALKKIDTKAAAKGLSRSDIIIARGKPKSRR
jgi:hypothetical protein